METFNPFSQEYEPKLSNRAIEELTDEIRSMARNMNELAKQVKNEAEEQNKNMRDMAANVALTVENFEENARLILLSAKKDLTDSVEGIVKAELEKQVNNANSSE